MAAKGPNNMPKTSKTAHVMNLLSKKQDPGVSPEAQDEAAPSVPPILSSIGSDAAVSVQIKNALEDTLESELGDSSPAPAAPELDGTPVQLEEPTPPPAQPEAPPTPPVQSETPPVQPEQAAPSEPTAPPEPASQAEQTPPPADPDPVISASIQMEHTFDLKEEEAHSYINVMQVLVEEKAAKYMQLFGLCQCHRCQDDVKALTLNHLPPKYVVMGQGEVIPKLTFYEAQYSSDITAQLLQACKMVMKSPHHNR